MDVGSMRMKKQPSSDIVLWVCVASILSAIFCILIKEENYLFNAFAFIAGIFTFLYAIYLADERLRQRGKSASWLIIFFGPAVAAIMFSQLFPEGEDKLIMLYIIVCCLLVVPPAVWGVCELSTKPNNEDKII